MKRRLPTQVSRPTLVKRALLLLVVFLLAGSVSWPPAADWVIGRVNALAGTSFPETAFPLVLGLDLQGGTRLEYSADLSKIPETEKPAAMEGVRDVIERRVNALGVSEPVVQTTKAGNDWRLSVELAGVRDISEAVRLIGETPTLDFREENPDAGKALTDAQYAELDRMNQEITANAQDALERVKDGASLQDIARTESEDGSASAGGDLGFLLDHPEYRGLFEQVRNADIGLVPTVVDDGEHAAVVEVLEKKDAGQEVRASHILVQWNGSQQSASTSTKEQALARIRDIQSRLTPDNFDEMARQYSEEPGAENTAGDLEWFGKGAMVEPFENAAFALDAGETSDVVETAFGYHLIKKTDERSLPDVHARAVIFNKKQASDIVDTDPWKRTALTGKQLSRAQLEFDPQTGQAQVALQFNGEGSDLFADLTKRNVGKAIGIFLDDQAISVPVVNQEIAGGQAVISGSFTVDEAKLLAQRLQAGALPVPISIIAQQNVGASLGAASVAASVQAALAGFLLVVLFMILMYRIPGLLAVVALAFYAAVLLALFKLIPVTLTLAGIAGFILSVGMAVDANVLIFERLKEEFRSGKPVSQAVDEAFKRAWLSIRDGNATTLIACAVLYWFSSSIIKGFALTLALGVLVSMFSAIVVTRVLLKLVAHPKLVERIPWLFLKHRPKV